MKLTHLSAVPLCLVIFSLPLLGQNETPATTADAATTGAATTDKPNTPTGEEQPARKSALVFGVDLYRGFSNIDGYRRYDDHMWAGYGPFVPSVVYAAYENERGYGVKLSLGTGDLFNTSVDEFYQPAEAHISGPLGKNLKFTLGKFWVPLALQEWEYESKPGAMLEWNRGAYGLTVAATHNQTTKNGNYYSRFRKSWGEHATIGLSLASGRGITFTSDHDRGVGLDGHYIWRDWEATTELLRFKRGSTGTFDFIWGKLTYNGWNKWTPFVSRYTWNDQLGQQGNFRSTVLGVKRQLTKGLSVETSYARVTGQNKWWAELHYNWEWPLGRFK